MNVSGAASNLINGVSRQSPSVRLSTQLEESINQWPTITKGLQPRPGTVLKAVLPHIRANAKVHVIDRDEQERYVVEASAQGVRVWDFGGNAKTVSMQGSSAEYLAGATAADLELMTVADHTFVLNKNRVVGKSSRITYVQRPVGLVYVVDGQFQSDYTIIIDGGERARFTTGGGAINDNTNARWAEKITTPRQIAHMLLHGTDTDGRVPSDRDAVGDPKAWLTQTLPAGEWNVWRLNSVIVISRKNGADFGLRVEADNYRTLRAFKGTVSDYEDLPKTAPQGYIVKVTGHERSDYDDYYVRFWSPSGNGGEGGWNECPAPDMQHHIDAATMPHLLVRNADGTFAVKPAEWGPRGTGDDETNPWPSFVGQRITGMVFAKNRLGFYHGESLTLSRHGQFYEFFVESLLTDLDTDPVDVTISYPDVSIIRNIVPAGEDMMVFTSSVPFRLTHGGDLLTPNTGEFVPLTENDAKSFARPVVAGGKVYFAGDSPDGSRIFELTVGDGTRPWEPADDGTSHVQGYLPAVVTEMVATELNRTLFLRSDLHPNHLWLYRWKWIGAERVQAAWQKWDFSGSIEKIYTFEVIGSELYIVARGAGGTLLLSVNLREAAKDGTEDAAHLDLKTKATGTYDASLDVTRYNLPIPAAGFIAFELGSDYGFQYDIQSVEGNSLYLYGDTRSKNVLFGKTFHSYGILSPLYYRPQSQDGSYGNATPGYETWIASVYFAAGQTAYLDVEVDRRYRNPYQITLQATQVGTGSGRVGTLVLGEIPQKVSCMARSADLKITFGTEGPYPYSINGLSWSGRAFPTAL